MIRCPAWDERRAVIAADSDDLKHHGAENSPWKNRAPSSLTTFRTSESTSIGTALTAIRCLSKEYGTDDQVFKPRKPHSEMDEPELNKEMVYECDCTRNIDLRRS